MKLPDHPLEPEISPIARDEFAIICQSNLLSYVAGFVDVLGFVALFGLFTNHVTGNIVMIGGLLTTHADGLIPKLLAIPVFVMCVALCRLVVLYYQRRGQQCWRLLFCTQMLFLLLFMLIGLAALPITDPDAPIAILAGMMGVAAMSIQNAQARLINPGQVPTTIMTGNITQAVIDMVDILSRDVTHRDTALKRLKIIGPAIFAFMAGVVTGAYAFLYISFYALLVPLVLLAGLVVHASLRRA